MAKASQFKTKDGAPLAQRPRGAVRRLLIYSDLPLDLPITRQEIQMIAETLGEDIAALFSGDE